MVEEEGRREWDAVERREDEKREESNEKEKIKKKEKVYKLKPQNHSWAEDL